MRALRGWRKKTLSFWAIQAALAVVTAFLLILWCEFFIYYISLSVSGCHWPIPASDTSSLSKGINTGVDEGVILQKHEPLKVLFFADTHLLGRKNGHWLDRLRREWQMERSFQTIVELYQPHTALLLGDAFDEGKWSGNSEWHETIGRLNKMFRHNEALSIHYIVGNHDIGFHNSMNEHLIKRYAAQFGPLNRVIRIEGHTFVALNSMAFKRDCNCRLCRAAREDLSAINSTLYGDDPSTPPERPILLLHFPLFRPNEKFCTEADVTPSLLRRFEVDGTELQGGIYNHNNTEDYEVINALDSDYILSLLRPRLILSGHTHYSCHYKHIDHNVTEITVSTFNWRNRDDPSFVLALLYGQQQGEGEGRDDGGSVSPGIRLQRCYLPSESTVTAIYCVGAAVWVLEVMIAWMYRRNRRRYRSPCLPGKAKIV